jgi:hypothetical protein
LADCDFRYCIALKNALFFRQPSGVELRRIFDKKQIAIGKWQLAFLGFGVSLRDVPQRLKPQDFIETYRRSKDLLHPAWDTVKLRKV